MEKCQQKELFQHFSKVEKIADRGVPQYSMQEVLDMAGLTWANVSEVLRQSSGYPGSSGVRELKGPGSSVREPKESVPAPVRASGVVAEDEVEGDGSEEGAGEHLTEDSDNNEAEDDYDESSGGRLGNAFEADDLHDTGTTRRSKGRGKGGRRAAGRGRGAGRVRRVGAEESLSGVRVSGSLEGHGRQVSVRLDAQAVKATGLVKAGMDQLHKLTKENWSELVTEGSANAIKKELERYATIFANKDTDIHASIVDCNFYSSLVPFMNAWRLHRGMVPDDVLSSHFNNLDAIQSALGRFWNGAELAPGLSWLYVQACFLHTIDNKGVPDALANLDLEKTKSIIRRQSTLFRQGISSEEVVNTE